jgi:hypothetical protein
MNSLPDLEKAEWWHEINFACPVLDTGESRKQGKMTEPVLLSPDAHPLDSRSPIGVEDKLYGNDVGGYFNRI